MSDASLHQNNSRFLTESEKNILIKLLERSSYKKLLVSIKEYRVKNMKDGGMGSIKFLSTKYNENERLFGEVIAEAEFVDIDGIIVSITLNIDKNSELYEMDFWKVDFSPLKSYPTPDKIKLAL
jgi:hypothetical protein